MRMSSRSHLRTLEITGLRLVENQLEIRSSTWTPARVSDSRDRPALGIMLDTVTLESVSSS